MLANLESKGLHAFGYTFAGMRHILMRDTRVEGVDDVAGKNMRIIPLNLMLASIMASAISNVSLPRITKWIMPFVLAACLVILVTIFNPWLVSVFR